MAVLDDYINSLPADKQEAAAQKIAGMSDADKKNLLSVAQRNADINALPPDQQEAAARKRIEDEQKIADQRVSESSNNSFPKNNPFKNKVVGTYNGKPVYQNSKGKQYFFTGKGGASFVPAGKLETATPPSPSPQSKGLMDSAVQTWDKLNKTSTGTGNTTPVGTGSIGTGGKVILGDPTKTVAWDKEQRKLHPELYVPEIQNVGTGQIPFNDQVPTTGTVPSTGTKLPPGYVTNNARRNNLLGMVSTYTKNKPNNFKSQILNFS